MKGDGQSWGEVAETRPSFGRHNFLPPNLEERVGLDNNRILFLYLKMALPLPEDP